jgi:predicted small lipoprotein YifL
MKRYLLGTVLASLMFVVAGCNHSGPGTRPDAQIATDVQNKINSDSGVPEKQVTINANNGVVTLSGTVSSDAARNAAANDAAQVDGVKTVVNNLEVNTATASNNMPAVPAPVMSAPAPSKKASPWHSYKNSPATTTRNNNNDDNGLRTTVPPTETSSAPSGNSGGNGSNYDSNAATSTPPPPPVPQPVTVPTGTQVSIRLTDQLDSEKSQVGDVFHGSISTPVVVEGKTVVPTSADVEGRVVEVKSAGRFAGQSDLVIELTRIHMNGKSYSIQTDRWSKQGNGRGKATAAKVGGGAAVGAILGGIFGGGKGAAIGAAAGAGAGTGVSAATKGQQIILKPETVLSFQLQNSISVLPGGNNRQAMNQ